MCLRGIYVEGCVDFSESDLASIKLSNQLI